MKVVTNTVYDTIKERAAATSLAVNEAVNKVVTGRKINNLSEDPFRVTELLNTRADLADIEQIGINLDMGKVWLETSEVGLSAIQDRLSQAESEAIKMSNDTYSAADRLTGSKNINELFNDMLEVANSDVNGRYLFGGSKTDKAPFIFVNDLGEKVDVNEATRVEYIGDKRPFTIKTDENEDLEVGRNGNAIFQGMFETMFELRDAMAQNDVEKINNMVTPLQEHQEYIRADISEVGSRSGRIEFRTNLLEEMNIATEERRANLEEVDITQAISDMRIKELAYQACLTTSTRILNMKTLMDYF
jgi:flagellar hook-associated protein 3 FlgL